MSVCLDQTSLSSFARVTRDWRSTPPSRSTCSRVIGSSLVESASSIAPLAYSNALLVSFNRSADVTVYPSATSRDRFWEPMISDADRFGANILSACWGGWQRHPVRGLVIKRIGVGCMFPAHKLRPLDPTPCFDLVLNVLPLFKTKDPSPIFRSGFDWLPFHLWSLPILK